MPHPLVPRPRRPVGRRGLGAGLLGLLLLSLLLLAPAPPATHAQTPTDWETALAARLNIIRASNGLAPLQLHAPAQAIARSRSADMLARGYFAHAIPGDGTVADLVAGQHIANQGVAELISQIGSDASDPVAAAEQQWLSAAADRAQLLDPAFTHMGVGAAAGAWNGHAGTRLFTVVLLAIPRPPPIVDRNPTLTVPTPGTLPPAAPVVLDNAAVPGAGLFDELIDRVLRALLNF